MPKCSAGPTFAGGQDVLYCKICSVPPEYCQYMDTPEACYDWLKVTHPEFYEELQDRKRHTKEERAAQIAALEAEKHQEADATAAIVSCVADNIVNILTSLHFMKECRSARICHVLLKIDMNK